MKRLPAWMIGVLTLLTALLLWVGIDERDEIGSVPIVLGVIWVVFILASVPKMFSPEEK